MGFWSKKPDKPPVQTPFRSELERFEGDFSVYSSDYWVSMKIWLPEALDKILGQLADHFECSQSELIRQALFIYVYGRYRFEQMRVQRGGLFKPEHLPLFSMETDPASVPEKKNRTPELGKNSVNTRVHLPAMLKDDLQVLARRSGISLSHFAREVLISTFLGHLTLPERDLNMPSTDDKDVTTGLEK